MKRSKSVHLTVLALASVSVVGCSDEPVQMTSSNAPRFSDRATCVRQYGEENCRYSSGGSSGGYYHPHFIPGQTYYYPGRGYYQGSPTQSYSRPAAAPSYSSPSPSPGSGVSTARGGGFGATGAIHGAGS